MSNDAAERLRADLRKYRRFAQLDLLDEALAAERTLDVERLARAIHSKEGFSAGTFDDCDCGDLAYAEALAAEYAREAKR